MTDDAAGPNMMSMNAMHTTTTTTTTTTAMRVAKIKISRIWAPGLPEALDPEGTLDDDYPPVIVGPADPDGEHELIDGFHRVRAAKADGRRWIWAIIVSPAELALLERMPEDDWIEHIQAMAEALD